MKQFINLCYYGITDLERNSWFRCTRSQKSRFHRNIVHGFDIFADTAATQRDQKVFKSRVNIGFHPGIP